MKNFGWTGPVGITFPGVVVNGVTMTAANLDPAWIGLDARALFSKAAACPTSLINDADAAGLAEMKFGAGAGHQGTVLMLTFGTGIGSALFRDGILVPNTEFGHIEIRGQDAEKRASERAKELHDLSWGKWAGRVDEYLHHVEALTAPDLIIIGGGISRKADKFLPLLTSLRATVVPAAMQNDAGIVGAALSAGLDAPLADEWPRAERSLGRRGRARPFAGEPAAAALPDRLPGGAQRVLDLADPQLAEVEHAGRQHRVGARPDRGREVGQLAGAAAGDDGHVHDRAYRADEFGSKPALVPSASMELSRISPTPSSAPRAAHCDRVDPGAAPSPVRGHLEATGPAGVAGRWPHPGSPAAGAGRPRTAPRTATRTAGPPPPSNSGRAMAAVFSDTLSAPARSSRSTSPTLRTPPPTVSGMNTWSAVRPTTSIMVSRSPLDAVMSRNTSSSAPSAS